MTRRALVHFGIEFSPSFGFFIAAQLYDFFTATAILMGLATTALVVGWLIEKKLPTLPIVITAFELIAGSITLYYRLPDALIISNTIYYALFGLLLLIGLLFRVNILKRILGETFALYDRGWNLLALRWAVVLLCIAIGNEYMRLMHSPEAWVDYRFYSMLGMMAFGLYQIRLSRRYRIPEESNRLGIRIKNSPV